MTTTWALDGSSPAHVLVTGSQKADGPQRARLPLALATVAWCMQQEPRQHRSGKDHHRRPEWVALSIVGEPPWDAPMCVLFSRDEDVAPPWPSWHPSPSPPAFHDIPLSSWIPLPGPGR